ncbi:MAG TPA: hypothetical protein VH280_17990 [Verrucomicrobiae bacterium]|jgi:hypothetical protein|nr:hypothetical protein [Verrucomicrobiae bacterium]
MSEHDEDDPPSPDFGAAGDEDDDMPSAQKSTNSPPVCNLGTLDVEARLCRLHGFVSFCAI